MGRRFFGTAAISILALVVSACASLPTAPAAVAPTDIPGSGVASTFVLSSASFTGDSAIPQKYTCDGSSISPQLQWSGAPANTKSFALIMDDPDAPAGTFTHWVAFDIPANQTQIAEGAKNVGKSGKNSAGQDGYTGPCPPSGTHRYYFTLYALDVASLGLNEGASRAQVETAAKAHTLAVTQLMGRYAR
jgi:Raf kinase inhibitor-like YbhB/YbcL family protein